MNISLINKVITFYAFMVFYLAIVVAIYHLCNKSRQNQLFIHHLFQFTDKEHHNMLENGHTSTNDETFRRLGILASACVDQSTTSMWH
jgi:hypothetical protein